MKPSHTEAYFEADIVAHLVANGWLLDNAAEDHLRYDRARALFPEDVLTWLLKTQPQEFAKAVSNGEAALLDRLCAVLDKEGPLDVFRKGFRFVAASGAGTATLTMCQFRPAFGINPEIISRYAAVRCRVVPQVRYSLHNENSIDLVLFLNGIPVATLELKTGFTQDIHAAVRQYKHDRLPKNPVTNTVEPLLKPNRRALVHFAVSSEEVYMTTRLAGQNTRFLPFNMGNNGAAGNPVNSGGCRTAYLWENVLQLDNWLDILGRFLQVETQKPSAETPRPKPRVIFPRYHQWDAVRALVNIAKREGAGHKYLVQHSAGSGKSNTIAWLAHQLQELHDDADKRCFDSVVVITDRRVLDSQLSKTISRFAQVSGTVRWIQPDKVKSAQLKEALEQTGTIIVVTLQTFPVVLDAIRKERNLKARSFAVIADEAHSSQSGASAVKLRKVLGSIDIPEGEDVSTEDLLRAEMEGRKAPLNVSFFAFTATPKAKTLELFGRPPHPDMPSGPDNLPQPFHLYTMQQAIEEGFILDVLLNYTPYKLAYKLAHNGKEYDEDMVDKDAARASLVRWVRLHEHNIAQKIAVIVEHFRHHVAHLLEGKAKAMVVTGSRKEVMRYKFALDKYLLEQGRFNADYRKLGALVAFSGELSDPADPCIKLTETSPRLNPALKGRDIADAFDTDEYQILLVADKYQTGFDQPMLFAMYVDKKLEGIAAVQTLSRLNRLHPGKTQTFILDFYNDPEEILYAFREYYREAKLADVSDPNILLDLQSTLDKEGIYTQEEIDAFVAAWLAGRGKTQKALHPIIDAAVERFSEKEKPARAARDTKTLDALLLFRKNLGSFVRNYDFLSQIIDYNDTDLEKRSIYYRCLSEKLKPQFREDVIDLSAVVMTHYKLKDTGKRELSLKDAEEPEGMKALEGLGTGLARDRETAYLRDIITRMNELFEGELSEGDLLNYANTLRDKILENETLAQQAAVNPLHLFALSPDFEPAMQNAVLECFDKNRAMTRQMLSSEHIMRGMTTLLAEAVYRGFAGLRERMRI
ncbi:MAG: DEAD/DEAH box helicase family protein [Desulfovibrio sp.]|jgi:type I restriction enzyme R subunit|nr:DEAD/DEAH box helicase family protein [Desulfovibrio sp.]